jgi:hypothetical protein
MGWKFWQTKDTESSVAVKGGKKLSRPKELPYEVGRHLVVVNGYSPDWVWQLKSALKPRDTAESIFDFRIFSPESAAESNVSVRDYNALGRYPELIIFEGWFDRETGKVQIDKLLEDVG